MVYIELVSLDGDEAVYDYMPESKDSDRGRVSYNASSGRRQVILKSSDDVGFNYSGFALKKIAEFAANGRFENYGMFAWY